MIPNTIVSLIALAQDVQHGGSEFDVNLLSTDGLIVVSNMILVIVTLVAVIISIKELRRRAKDSDDAGQESEERLAKIVHLVIENEHEEDMAKLHQKDPRPSEGAEAKPQPKNPDPGV